MVICHIVVKIVFLIEKPKIIKNIHEIYLTTGSADSVVHLLLPSSSTIQDLSTFGRWDIIETVKLDKEVFSAAGTGNIEAKKVLNCKWRQIKTFNWCWQLSLVIEDLQTACAQRCSSLQCCVTCLTTVTVRHYISFNEPRTRILKCKRFVYFWSQNYFAYVNWVLGLIRQNFLRHTCRSYKLLKNCNQTFIT